MTDFELHKSFEHFVNTSIIPNDVAFYDSFNKNTNNTLKMDFMIVIFSTFNDNLIPAFLNNLHPFVFMFTDYQLVASLLNWCCVYNHSNYLKYIINNLYNIKYSDFLEFRSQGECPTNFNTNTIITELFNYILILKKYNFSKKLEYIYRINE
jgi:hypothetical protein